MDHGPLALASQNSMDVHGNGHIPPSPTSYDGTHDINMRMDIEPHPDHRLDNACEKGKEEGKGKALGGWRTLSACPLLTVDRSACRYRLPHGRPPHFRCRMPSACPPERADRQHPLASLPGRPQPRLGNMPRSVHPCDRRPPLASPRAGQCARTGHHLVVPLRQLPRAICRPRSSLVPPQVQDLVR
jgi:hypothetical protein